MACFSVWLKNPSTMHTMKTIATIPSPTGFNLKPRSSRSTCQAIRAAITYMLVLVPLASAQAPYEFWVLAKGANYEQRSATAPIIDEYEFEAFVQPRESGFVQSATLHTPLDTVEYLIAEDGQWSLPDDSEYATESELNALWPSGNYVFSIAQSTGAVEQTLTLSGSNYPVVPQFANWSAAQAVDPAQPFTIHWNAFAGAGPDDLVRFEMYYDPVLGDEEDLFGEMLPASQTSFTIPAATLSGARPYKIAVMFIKVVDTTTDGLADFGAAIFWSRTEMDLRTTGTSSGLQEWQLNFSHYNGNHFLNQTGPNQYRCAVDSGAFPSWNVWADLVDASYPPASEVSIQGPVGSNLNATAQYFSENTRDDQPVGGYSFPSVNNPSAPVAGAYTLRYRGVDYTTNLAASPYPPGGLIPIFTFTVDGQSNITNYTLTYQRLSDGAVVPSPADLDYLHLYFDPENGEGREVELPERSLGGTFPLTDLRLADYSRMGVYFGSDEGSYATDYTIVPLAHAVPWPDVYQIDSVYKWTSWLGFFHDHFYPWVFTNEMGWFYVVGDSIGNLWFYHLSRGWMWTSNASYPFLYSLDRSNWVWLNAGEVPAAWYAQNPNGGYEPWP